MGVQFRGFAGLVGKSHLPPGDDHDRMSALQVLPAYRRCDP